jgi:S-formylglutathione hydrolase FrmB
VVAVAFMVIALVALGAGAAVVVARNEKQQPPSAPRSLTVVCRSPALGGRMPATVYLPAGYRDTSTRYRVVFFLHGLPAGPNSYKDYAFVASALSASRHTIVVAPQGARNDGDDREYLDWSPTENWPQAISHDLPQCIDHRFRTIDSRFGRALIGLSAGGYGAMNIGLRHLATFAAVESWSGYFEATDPSGTHVLDLGSNQANLAARVPTADDLKLELATWPSLIAFYVGNQDARFLDMNKEFNPDLAQAQVPHLFAVYSGGHSRSLWQSKAPKWLTMALDYMAADAKRRGR